MVNEPIHGIQILHFRHNKSENNEFFEDHQRRVTNPCVRAIAPADSPRCGTVRHNRDYGKKDSNGN